MNTRQEARPRTGLRPWGGIDGIAPDALSGVVFALEGVQDATVLLNGPTGCKYYHGALSDSQTIRNIDFDPISFPMKWYFGQPRVPSTFLDNSDYVYGSEYKLADALDYFREQDKIALLCIVNTPGAALIGDDLERIAHEHLGAKPFLTVETPGFSEGLCAGFEAGAQALIDQTAGANTPRNPERGRINLLGLPLYLRNFAGDVEEMTRLAQLCDLSVGCALCAGGTLEDAKRLPDACLNVVVYPEFGLQTARYLEERFGTPYYLSEGPPVGFDATEAMFAEIAEAAGGNTHALMKESKQARMRCFSHISRISSITGLPKGVPFAVEGTYSELYAYTSFLASYLAMVPAALWPAFPQTATRKEALVGLLRRIGASEALDARPGETEAELVFASGETIARLRLEETKFSGVETMLPTLGYVDVVPKTYLGIRGAMHLVEAVLNGLAF